MSIGRGGYACTICGSSTPPGRKLYCSDRCMFHRGNHVARTRRRRAQQREATCKRCGAWWTHLAGGQLPALCPGCKVGHRWCASCDTVKALDQFHRDGNRGRNRTCAACCAEYARDPRVREDQRWGLIRRTYGLTRADYDAMVEVQGGCCAICEKPPTEFVVDHCHTTGKVRALLCRKCNMSIGIFGDDPIRVKRALDYLLAHAS